MSSRSITPARWPRAVCAPVGGALAVLALLAVPAAVWAAGDFAPAGARGTLVLEASFESSGREGKAADLREWKVLRTLRIEAQLAAQAPTAWGAAGPDATQASRVAQMQTQAVKTQQQMAPLMAGAQALVARCGDDDACLEREAAKLGMGMSGTPQLANAQKAGQAMAAVSQPGEAKVQRWLGSSQVGSYQIHETLHRVHADPICMSLPKGRCTRDERRDGQGALPGKAPGSLASVEVDLGRQQLQVQLPMAPDLLAYTELITTDEPEGTHETPTPKGPQAKERLMALSADGQPAAKLFTVPLRGGWRSQSGEQRIAVPGAGPAGGTLILRWRFHAP